MWSGGVTHDPPRRTYWFTMNFPLYSPTAPGAGSNPGYGQYAEDVHCQTLPNGVDSAGAPVAGVGWSLVWSKKCPCIERPPAATSHSASVGSRMPAQWA